MLQTTDNRRRQTPATVISLAPTLCVGGLVNRFFMKLFKSSNIAVINECQKMSSYQLPNERLSHRTSRFLSKVALVDNNFIKYTTQV